jgi:bacillopeptidase F (M6 metalloprotease family)
MKQPLKSGKGSRFVCIAMFISVGLLVVLLTAGPASAQKAPPRIPQKAVTGDASQSVVWCEDWLSGWGLWYADNGVWDVGNPTNGPGGAHSDTMCAATVLDGNYPDGANSRLISPPISLPSSPQDGALSLTFWHWFSFAGGDKGYVEISVNNGPWEPLSKDFAGYCGGPWTKYIVDISSYIGQSVRFAFHIDETGYYEAEGWYVDDICVIEGECDPWLPEDFEGPVECWYADNGVWEIGVPTHGPSQAYGGSMCAGTVLDGNYPAGANSRLISPSISLPSSPQDGALWLSFWHWFHITSGDTGYVEISVDGGPWQPLSDDIFGHCGGAWTKYIIDISSYVGQSVRFAFHIVETGYYQAEGWYIDEVDVFEGAAVAWAPEDFEGDVGRWYADSGVWEIGIPTHGPGQAYGGSKSAGTVLDGNYPDGSNSRLISPAISLPSSPQDGALSLTLWHWFSFAGGDTGYVEVSVNDGPWEPLSEGFIGYCGGAWTKYIVDISSYIGQSVRFGFHIVETGYYEAEGWYIDDLDIVEGVAAPWTPEGFEGDVGWWYADNGVWETGEAKHGPSRNAFNGEGCAGTILDGDYPAGANSRLISPSISLPSSPEDGALWLSFWHWFYITGGDTGYVEISVDGGPWEPLSKDFVGHCGGVWTKYIVDISSYIGQSVKFAFHMVETGYYQAAGWYIDEVDIVEGAFPTPNPNFFENKPWSFRPLFDGWHASNGVWQVGEPGTGPASSFGGRICAGTVLDGNYPDGADSRLISPVLTLPTDPLDGDLWLTFWHWFEFAGGDRGYVEISANGGEWDTLTADFAGYCGGVWTNYIADISSYTGQSVRFALHIVESGYYEARGWYVDNVSVIEGPKILNNPEDFADGTRGWYASHGVWEIGRPTAGPGVAYSDSFCAGTVLDGNYPAGSDSRLITPKVTLPGVATMLRFVHWHSLANADSGFVEISTDGDLWTRISTPFTGTGSVWSPYIIDLASYAGQTVQFAFRIQESSTGLGAGWYIDDFQIINVPETAPNAPTLVSVDYTSGPPELTWVNPSGDYEYISIYAGQDSNFVPDLGSRIALVNGTSFSDTARPGWGTYYKISAVDADWHESGTDGPDIMTAVDDETPEYSRTELLQNRPNPFNPTTTIQFSLSKAGPASVVVYDVTGRKVVTLLDQQKGAGQHSITFNASGVASGVYFYRLRTPGFEQTRKMVILK